MKAGGRVRDAGVCGWAGGLRWLAAPALVAALAGAPLVAPAQQLGQRAAGTNPTAKLYRIAGTVTNSVTDEVVAGVTLTLQATLARVTIQTTVTDASGHFALDPVAAGKYSLRASRRGFMTSNFDQHDQYSSAIVTGEGQDTEHIPFRLNPGAMVRGVVTDDAGEPVENAKVLLMRRTWNGGLGEHLVESIAGETDDNGLFELWNLLPGTYFLAVKATPWFALHPPQSRLNAAADAEQRETMATLDVAYPVTYYGGVVDESAASPIEIASGDRVTADVALHAVPALHLAMHVPEGNPEPQKYMGRPFLRQTIFGDQDFMNYAAFEPGSQGSGLVEFSGVAPGHYSVLQGDPPRVTEIDATGSQEVDLSPGTSTFGVDMKVKMADGAALPKTLDLILMSDDAVLRQLRQRVEKAEAHFDSVTPGRWNLLAFSDGLWLGVASIQTGAAPVADSRIVVKDRRLKLNVVLALGKTNIEGFVNKDGKGEPGVMVVLVPKNPDSQLEEFRRDQSDSDGSFLLQGVTPGDYTIVAIEDGWELDWARAKGISPYLRGGMAVTVTAASGESMHLSAPVAVQAR
jgi:hypothetical protein